MRLSLSDLHENMPVRIELDGIPVCVAKVDGEVFAIGDTCSHSDASLSEGEITDGLIECWLHGAQFNLKTGEAVTPPAVSPVEVFQVKYEGDFVSISKGERNE